jgi:hypothetical protein
MEQEGQPACRWASFLGVCCVARMSAALHLRHGVVSECWAVKEPRTVAFLMNVFAGGIVGYRCRPVEEDPEDADVLTQHVEDFKHIAVIVYEYVILLKNSIPGNFPRSAIMPPSAEHCSFLGMAANPCTPPF